MRNAPFWMGNRDCGLRRRMTKHLMVAHNTSGVASPSDKLRRRLRWWPKYKQRHGTPRSKEFSGRSTPCACTRSTSSYPAPRRCRRYEHLASLQHAHGGDEAHLSGDVSFRFFLHSDSRMVPSPPFHFQIPAMAPERGENAHDRHGHSGALGTS